MHTTLISKEMARILQLLIFASVCHSLTAAIDHTPKEKDPFKAHFKRNAATKELVFTYESDTFSGTAFLVEIFGATYIATNRHVLDSVISKGDDNFKLENNHGRWLKIDSEVYWQIRDPEIGSNFETDLVLIPYPVDKFHYVMKPFEMARDAAEVNQTVITYGNTDGQGYINAKEGILSRKENKIFEYIAEARAGNSGGPVLNLNNRVVGIHTAGTKEDLQEGEVDRKTAIRLDMDVVNEWYTEGRFEIKRFTDNAINFYKEEIYTDIVPEPHHSRDKLTPHLSIGLAVGNLGDAEIGSLEQLEQVWDMKRRGSHRPLLCYNFDVLPRDRQIKLCATYGQTMAEFIPRDWFKSMLSAFVTLAQEEYENTSNEHSRALRAQQSINAAPDRSAAISSAKELKIFNAMRDAYNVNFQHGYKMRLNGELVEIPACIENLDTGE